MWLRLMTQHYFYLNLSHSQLYWITAGLKSTEENQYWKENITPVI